MQYTLRKLSGIRSVKGKKNLSGRFRHPDRLNEKGTCDSSFTNRENRCF